MKTLFLRGGTVATTVADPVARPLWRNGYVWRSCGLACGHCRGRIRYCSSFTVAYGTVAVYCSGTVATYTISGFSRDFLSPHAGSHTGPHDVLDDVFKGFESSFLEGRLDLEQA